ncbi:MAG: stage III sporulation protein AB [Syntrophomonadaceae bacterium]|nr:stage III sporulation protein AB [Syntrophomonadaceae bacterium]
MLKLFGALLVVITGGFIGFGIAEKYRLRPLQLRAIQSSLMMLQTEISYTATPLPEALNRVAARCEFSAKELFAETARGLQKKQGLTASEAWASTLLNWQKKTVLKPGELSILHNLGEVLGTSEREEQIKHLLLAREQLHEEEVKAEKDRSKNETMWKYAGLLISLLIVVIIY